MNENWVQYDTAVLLKIAAENGIDFAELLVALVAGDAELTAQCQAAQARLEEEVPVEQ